MNRIITGKRKKIYFYIIDVFFFMLAHGAALTLCYISGIPSELLTNFWRDSIVIAAVMATLFQLFGLYDSLWQFASVEELISTGIAAIAGIVVLFFLSLLMHVAYPHSWYFIFALLIMLFNGGIRILYRIIRRSLTLVPTSERDAKRILVVGAGEAAAMVLREMNRNPQLGKVPVVMVDDDQAKLGQKIYGVPIKGNRYDIKRLVKEEFIDEIIIAIPTASQKDVRDVVELCKETHSKLQILPALYQLIDGKVSMKKLRDVDVVDLLGREPVNLSYEHIRQYLRGKTVLVTGGGGSIGSELCRQVAAFEPKQLIIFDIYENSSYDIQNELRKKFPNLSLSVEIGSVRDKRRLENLFDKHAIEVVFHAAAHKHVPLMEDNPREAILNNVMGTYNLALTAKARNVDRFLMISTDKAVNPTNIMGASKRIAEMIVQTFNGQSKTEFVAVRFGNVLGSNGSVIPLFRRQIAEGGPVTVTDPEIIRYFMTIPEAVQLVLETGTIAKGGEIFVLDMGDPVKILKLAEDLIKLSGYEPYEEIDIVFTGLRPGEKLYEELLMADEGMDKTENDKIFIGHPPVKSLAQLTEDLDRLEKVVNEDAESIRAAVMSVVPTYQPNEA
jgi:FlaA1/EpsC-like NDP-sugar epimerase